MFNSWKPHYVQPSFSCSTQVCARWLLSVHPQSPIIKRIIRVNIHNALEPSQYTNCLGARYLQRLATFLFVKTCPLIRNILSITRLHRALKYDMFWLETRRSQTSWISSKAVVHNSMNHWFCSRYSKHEIYRTNENFTFLCNKWMDMLWNLFACVATRVLVTISNVLSDWLYWISLPTQGRGSNGGKLLVPSGFPWWIWLRPENVLLTSTIYFSTYSVKFKDGTCCFNRGQTERMPW